MTTDELRIICEVGRKKRVSGEVLNVLCENTGGDYLSILYILNTL